MAGNPPASPFSVIPRALTQTATQMDTDVQQLAAARQKIGDTRGQYAPVSTKTFGAVPNSAKFDLAYDELADALTTAMDRSGAAMSWIADGLRKGAQNYEEADQAAADVYRKLRRTGSATK